MRTFPCVLSLSLLLIASLASAQQERKTDAQRDDLLGPVKTVSTVVSMSQVKWQQPGGPTLVLPVWCRDCSYDPDGTKTVSGQIVNGSFLGDLIDVRRDGNGRVIERTFTLAATGLVLRHQVVGPFGTTEETDYDTTGKVSYQQTIGYDQYGRGHDRLSMDGDGKLQSHCVTTHTKDGVLTSDSCWDKNNQLNWQQTYDPERDLEHFTVFDESGAVKLIWTRSHGQVVSFWEQPGQPHGQAQFGENFSESLENGNVENYSCHENGQCDRAHIHYEYLDRAKKRNPTSAEWRDAGENLVVAAYFEYQLDSAGNWTHRKVWVWPSEQGDRALYEADSRTITYWQK